MTSPTLGVGLLTDLPRARSACCGVSVALALLLPEAGSNWSAWLMVAVLVCGLGLTTVAVMVRVCGAVVVTVPTDQTPLALLYVPALEVAESNVSPGGSRSLTATLVAALGPLSLRVTV